MARRELKPQHKNKRHTIAQQHTVRLLLAFAAGVLVFLTLQISSDFLLDRYLERSGYYAAHEEKYVQSLQDFVRDRHLTSSDLESLNEWGQQQGDVFFQIYDNDHLLAQYYSRDSRSFKEAASLGFLEWIEPLPLAFSNQTCQVLIFGDYYYKPFRYMNIVSILAAFSVFLIIFLTGIRKRTRYIRLLRDEIEILGGGDLSYEITIQGNDELSDLADNLNQMRQALKHYIEEEVKLTEDRKKIVTRLSHDIRTPLTSMRLFADLLRQDRYRDEAQRDHYLERIQENAANLSDMAEELFRAASEQDQAEPEKQPVISAKAGQSVFSSPLPTEDTSAEDAPLVQYLADAAEALQLSGFMVREIYTAPDPAALSVPMDRSSFVRVLDNITSNILQYADPAEPVQISLELEQDGALAMGFSNKVSLTRKENRRGTGIGLRNVRELMGQAGGTVEINTEAGAFQIMLCFPLS